MLKKNWCQHLYIQKVLKLTSINYFPISGLRRPIKYSVNDMKKKFKVHTISAAVQCAGNRRSNMASLKSVRGENQ